MCRISKFKGKMGKETGGKKMEDHQSFASNPLISKSFEAATSQVGIFVDTLL